MTDLVSPTLAVSSPRVALVTGANKGIGFEISRQLAKAGVRVVLGARDPQKGDEAARTLRAEGFDVDSIRIDLGDAEALAGAAADFEKRFSRLDILVNNAGIAHREDGPPETASIEAVRATLETNVVGTLAVTQVFLPLLKTSTSARMEHPRLLRTASRGRSHNSCAR